MILEDVCHVSSMISIVIFVYNAVATNNKV